MEERERSAGFVVSSTLERERENTIWEGPMVSIEMGSSLLNLGLLKNGRPGQCEPGHKLVEGQK